MSDCIFCKIRDGEIPADIIYRDDVCLAFRDIHPAAPQHVLLIPTEHIASLNEVTPDQEGTLGHILGAAKKVAARLDIGNSGYRVVANCNSDAGQEVFHIHFHLLGGRKLSWPPG